ncbi:fimbria/pilus outer membrane usher protein [Pseudomonas sp.]|uniref:fimbria/pilus outer membrane usher protein n=1 Tax=Pseudomonas sp. TaxID=306 RepID=UPI00260ACEE3|nr:fimbria/pilus outer membrane usher protein [Pseudomonas sp.]
MRWVFNHTALNPRCHNGLLILSVLLLTLDASAAESQTPEFNLKFLQGTTMSQDTPETLNTYLNGASIPPGEYSVDLHINNNRAPRQTVTFERNPNSGAVEACISQAQMMQWGLDIDRLIRAGTALTDTGLCPDWNTLIEHYNAQFNAQRQELHVSFPQALMSKEAQGYIDPQLWDAGITAGFIDYSLIGRSASINHVTSRYANAGLRSGLNLGEWRLRNESAYSLSNDQKSEFQNNRTYAQRDITSLQSQLTLGATYTSSQIFDSVRFKGVQVQTDENMLPESRRGFAPVVRGIAQSNATVEVRQNGFLIYNENVPPGAFEITDVYPSGSNGDLEITVIEADGQRTVFAQSFATLPQMVRRGMVRYSLAAGEYDNVQGGEHSPKLALAGLTYGLTDDLSVFGGVLGAEGFHAENLGVTKNTPYGAFSTNITRSNSKNDATPHTGHSLQLNYVKTITSTDTTFSLAGYRFSSDGYRTLSEHVADQSAARNTLPVGRTRARLDVTINQTLGNREYGSIYLSANEQSYWNLTGRTQQLNLGYANSWRSLDYSINATYSQYPQGSNYNNPSQLLFTVSAPLGESSRVRSYSTLTALKGGGYKAQTGISGALPSVNDTYYNAQFSHDSQNEKSGLLGIRATTPAARFNASYNQGRNSNSVTLGANGSIVSHAGGINLGQSLSESFALAHVPGAQAGTRIGNYSSVTVGNNGYAVIPSTRPYRYNWINLNTQDLTADIELENTMQQLIPRRGSITRSSFKTVTGRRVQMELVDASGKPLAFGSTVTNESGLPLAVVDPDGYALIMAEQRTGTVVVNHATRTCRGTFVLPPKSPDVRYEQIRLICH